MPIVFDNKNSGRTTGDALAFNLTAVANATLLVFYGTENDHSVSSMAYNGVALTRLASAVNGAVELWGLTAPAIGSNQLLIKVPNATNTFCAIGLTYAYVKSTNPFGTPTSATAGSVTNVNLSISSTATDLAIGAFYVNFNSITVNNGNTRASETCGASTRLVVADITGAPSVTLSAGSGSNPSWIMLGIPLRFSALAANSGAPFAHMLTGIGR